jgi:hypothetical protein
MPIATNPQTGETVYLADDGAWKPAQIATNPQTKERMAFDGKEWATLKPATPSKGVLGYVDDAVRSVANGLTFGYMDELAAKADEITGRAGPYKENLDRERARDKQIPAAISIPGEIAGAVGSTVLAAPAVGAGAAMAGLSKIPTVAKFAGLGAAEGALAGSGNAVEGDRLSGAATGAAIGGAVGTAAPYVVQGVAKGANAIRNAASPEANVSADLARAIARDGDDAASLMARTNNASIDRPGVATLAERPRSRRESSADAGCRPNSSRSGTHAAPARAGCPPLWRPKEFDGNGSLCGRSRERNYCRSRPSGQAAVRRSF